MNEKLFTKIGKAYYGNDNKNISPAIIALIMQLLQGLLANCVNPQGVKTMMVFPILSGARRRIRASVATYAMQSGEDFDQDRVCKTIEKLGTDATVAEINEVRALDPQN